MEKRMQSIYQRYGIPADTPYRDVASNGGGGGNRDRDWDRERDRDRDWIGIGGRSGTVIATATALIGNRTSIFPVKIRAASTVIFSAGKIIDAPTTATK